jgi:hypothetical protein
VTLATTHGAFLRALVKIARKRPHQVRRVDRVSAVRAPSLKAGSDRKVGELARSLNVSKPSLLRLAAERPPRGKPVRSSA